MDNQNGVSYTPCQLREYRNELRKQLRDVHKELNESSNKTGNKTGDEIGCMFYIALFGFFIISWYLMIVFKACCPIVIKFISLHYLKFIFILGISIFVILITKEARKNRMLDRLMMDADEKEFSKITRDLCREKYISLKTYFKATSTFESANNFLKSCRGVVFLDAYKKESKIDNIIISKLILDVERDEQIVSCAVDILKTYRD